MGIVVYFVGAIKLPVIVILIIQVIVGAVVYIALSMKFHLEAFEYLWGMLKSMVSNMRK